MRKVVVFENINSCSYAKNVYNSLVARFPTVSLRGLARALRQARSASWVINVSVCFQIQLMVSLEVAKHFTHQVPNKIASQGKSYLSLVGSRRDTIVEDTV